MHIPDGYLSPQTYIPLYGASVLFWALALRRIKRDFPERHIPYLAMAGAFSFLIQMFNIPIPGGTTGHAVGGAIIALLLGPWAAVIAISTVLIIQAVVFGDGGITALGANCFNAGVVIPFASYGIFKIITSGWRGNIREMTPKRIYTGAFLAGYLGLTAGAILTAFVLGIQPLIAHDPEGRPLYAPYPLKIAIPVMAIQHMLLFGIVEGILTVAILRYFMKHAKEDVYALKPSAYALE